MSPRELPEGARRRLGTTLFRPGQGFLPPVLSPDGERMLVEDREGHPRLHLVETRTGRLLETLPALSDELGQVLALSWTAEGIRVACQLYGGKPALLEYTSSRVRPLESQDAPWADDAAFSADGQHVAMVDQQGAVRVWSTRTGRQIARARPLTGTPGGPGTRRAVAMSADGRWVAWSVGDSRIHLYDVASRRLRPALQGHTGTVAQLAFSPDGTRLASAALMREPCIRIWDVEQGAAVLELAVHGESSPTFCFVGPGARLAWLDGEALRTRELLTGASTSRTVGTVLAHTALSASPDGTWVVAREGHALRTWNLDTGMEAAVGVSHSRPVRTVAVSADGSLTATSDDGGEVLLWELSSGRSLGRLELTTAHGCLRFSPEGRWLAVGSAEGQLHLWSREEGRVLHAFSSSLGVWVTGHRDCTALVWETALEAASPGAEPPATRSTRNVPGFPA